MARSSHACCFALIAWLPAATAELQSADVERHGGDYGITVRVRLEAPVEKTYRLMITRSVVKDSEAVARNLERLAGTDD